MSTGLIFPAEISDLATDLLRFEHDLQNFAAALGLDLAEHEIDHIALRCHQNTTAERWQRGLEEIATPFSSAIINGRQISLFRLHQPWTVAGSSIDVVELPWPGEKRYRHEGFEHVEVVLRGDHRTLGQRAMALIDDRALMQPGVSFKTRSPQGENEALPNPTLAVTNGAVTIKFHPWRLEEIVASETC